MIRGSVSSFTWDDGVRNAKVKIMSFFEKFFPQGLRGEVKKKPNLGPFRESEGNTSIDLQERFMRTGKFYFVDEFKDGAARVHNKKGSYYVINEDGKEISEKFDFIHEFHDGIARVQKSGKYSYINTRGVMLADKWFDRVNDFSNSGLASVMEDGKWFLVKKDLEKVTGEIEDFKLPYSEEDVGEIGQGAALIKKDGRWFTIDKDGNELPVQENIDNKR